MLFYITKLVEDTCNLNRDIFRNPLAIVYLTNEERQNLQRLTTNVNRKIDVVVNYLSFSRIKWVELKVDFSVEEIKNAKTFPPIDAFEKQKNHDAIDELYIVAIKLDFEDDSINPLQWLGIPQENFSTTNIDHFTDSDRHKLANYLHVSPEDYYQAKIRFDENLLNGFQ